MVLHCGGLVCWYYREPAHHITVSLPKNFVLKMEKLLPHSLPLHKNGNNKLIRSSFCGGVRTLCLNIPSFTTNVIRPLESVNFGFVYYHLSYDGTNNRCKRYLNVGLVHSYTQSRFLVWKSFLLSWCEEKQFISIPECKLHV